MNYMQVDHYLMTAHKGMNRETISREIIPKGSTIVVKQLLTCRFPLPSLCGKVIVVDFYPNRPVYDKPIYLSRELTTGYLEVNEKYLQPQN